MASEIVERLRAAVRDVPDFPKKGIVFKDITPVLSDPVLFRASIDLFLERCRGKTVDKIVGIDARGFLFGSAVAYELGLGFVPIRKRGKLPYRTDTAKYSLEYGEAEMEMHTDAVTKASALCWWMICSRRVELRPPRRRLSETPVRISSRHNF